MLDGGMLLWFLLTALSLLFVVVDVRTTPESPGLKWGSYYSPRTRGRWEHFCMYWVLVKHSPGCTNATSRHAGGRFWVRPCIV